MFINAFAYIQKTSSMSPTSGVELEPGDYEVFGLSLLKCDRLDCGRILPSRQELIYHLREDHRVLKPFTCHSPACTKEAFLNETKLVEHLRDYHRTEKGWIPCTKCLTPFTDLNHLKVHILICHFDGQYTDETPNDSSNSCSPTCSSTSSPDGREYVCEFAKCGERFQTRQQLERHQKYHYGLKPHRNGGDWAAIKHHNNNNHHHPDSSQLSPGEVAGKLVGRKRFYPIDEDTVSNDSHYAMADFIQLNMINNDTSSSVDPFSKPNSPDSKCSQGEIVTPMTSDDDEDDDESFYGDYSEADLLGAKLSDVDGHRWCLNLPQRKSRMQYFWQYNSHSKRLKDCARSSSEDKVFEAENPYVFNEISDPVFAESAAGHSSNLSNFRYNGKIRKCDGNDWTPNPKKLLMIGLELKKLTDLINTLNVRTTTSDMALIRREKNKLTSRICRLKKKAQNEANKIKLYGLFIEHSKLVKTRMEIRNFLIFSANQVHDNPGIETTMNVAIDDTKHEIDFPRQVPAFLDTISGQLGPLRSVAGVTTDFVNFTLDNVAKGLSDGGMDCV